MVCPAQKDGAAEQADDDKLILGKISGVHGVQGWVKVYSWTEPMESIVDYSPWFIRPQPVNPKNTTTSPWTRVKLKAGRKHGKTLIAKLEHCNDRDQAAAYMGFEIAIEPGQLETLQAENEFYWRELIGLRVVNRQQEELGTVTRLMETGVNDVLVVFSDTENRERLVPWTPGHAIDRVDREHGVIHVDWDADF